MRLSLTNSISMLLGSLKRLWIRPSAALSVFAIVALTLVGCGASDDDKGDGDGNDNTSGSGNGGSGGSIFGGGGKSGASSSNGGVSNHGPNTFTETPGSWTYLVYMLADNDLEPFGLSDLQEMMTVGSSADLQILVQVDRAEGESSDGVGGLPDFTSTKRVRVNAGSLEELDDLGETNMGDPATLTDFITWGLAQSPTDHVALVLWDHGGAWPQYGVDFSANNDGLSLPELTTALGNANLQRSFDIIGFDACLMATWEVASTLAPYGRFLLASEEVEPGHGWDHSALASLTSKPKGSEFALALLNGYVNQAEAEGTAQKITISVTDMDQIQPLSDALTALSTKLGGADVATHAPLVAKARGNSPTFGEQPGGASTGMTDITLLMDAIAASDPDVANEVTAVKTALNGAVLSNQVSEVYSGAGGLSLYFPLFAENYDAKYDDVGSAEPWRGFLQALYGSAQNLGSPPVFTNPDHTANTTFTEDGLLVEGQLQEGTFDNLATATFSYAVVDQDSAIYYVGSVPADVDASGLVSSTWDLTVMTVGQGNLQDYGYYSLELSDDGYFSVSIPLAYQELGSEPLLVVLSLVLDTDGNIVANTYYAETAGAWGELSPLEGSTFTTLLPVLYPGETETVWEQQTAVFDATQPLNLDFVALEAGIVIGVELVAVDYANQGDAVSAIGPL